MPLTFTNATESKGAAIVGGVLVQGRERAPLDDRGSSE